MTNTKMQIDCCFQTRPGVQHQKLRKTIEFQKVRNDKYDNADRFCCEVRPGVQNQ